MYEHLYKYLVLHRRLDIPGLGRFLIENVPARVDDGGKLIQGPVPVITFRQQAVQADKQFYDFLSWEMDTDEVEAISHFRDYTEELKVQAAKEPGAELPEIGRLFIHADGSTEFRTAVTDVHELLPPVSLPDGIVFAHTASMPHGLKTNQEHTNEELAAAETDQARNNNWWIYAAILLLLGIGFILFYYA